jgi:hypothetical protein
LSGKQKRVRHDGLVGLDDLTTCVGTAVRADVVGAAGPSALRAELELDDAEREVRTAASLASLGELYLG